MRLPRERFNAIQDQLDLKMLTLLLTGSVTSLHTKENLIS